MRGLDYSEYLEPRYRLKQIAEAASFPLNTLRSNYQRGLFRSFSDRMGVGKGRAQRLCLGDALILAIASRLIDLGVGPQNAYNVAIGFGLVAKTPRGMARRLPFELFDPQQFDSILIWRLGCAAQVIPVNRDNGAIPLGELGLDDPGGSAVVVLPLNAVVKSVCAKLAVAEPDRARGT